MYQSPSDADQLIVMTTVESTERQPTVLIGEDMDLLVLLLYPQRSKTANRYFSIPSQSHEKTGGRLWDILSAKLKLGDTLCDQILFLHAFFGCDLTSRIYGIGKSTPLNHAKKKEKLPGYCTGLFLDSASTKDMALEKRREKAMLIFFKAAEN